MADLIRYTMTAQINAAPFERVSWVCYDTPDLTGALSGFTNLTNIAIDYQTVNGVSTGGTISNSTPIIPISPIPTDNLVAYVMKGTINLPPYTNVNWTVYTTPDFTGELSGFTNLTNIQIDYQIVNDITSESNNLTNPAPAIPDPPDPIVDNIAYIMKGIKNTPPYEAVNWRVYGTPDFTGALSGFTNLTNIQIDYQVINDITSGGGNSSNPTPVIPDPPDPIVAKLGYTMKALLNTPPYEMVNWTVWGTPDFTGEFSGYPPSNLIDICVDYTIVDDVSRGPQALPIINVASGPAGGDLSNSYPNPKVVGLQTVPISNTTPTLGQVLTYNGTNWIPETPIASTVLQGDVTGFAPATTVEKIRNINVQSGTPTDGYVLTYIAADLSWEPKPTTSIFTAANDLSGSGISQTVIGLYNNPLANTTPVASAVPVYSTTNTRYDIRKLTLDDLDPAFAISSFSGGSTVEVGATITNPTFTASYTSSPSSANITNTDGTDSPHTLITPFTSGTITGSFHKIVVASVVFTLTAIAATTKTATSNINFYARSFFGIGTAGATSATASGNNATLVGATGTLINNGIQSTVVETTSGTLAPSSQKIYFLCIHTTTPHTFHDQNGFGFPMNTPTTFSFTNQNSATVPYDLYESQFALSTNFILTVVT